MVCGLRSLSDWKHPQPSPMKAIFAQSVEQICHILNEVQYCILVCASSVAPIGLAMALSGALAPSLHINSAILVANSGSQQRRQDGSVSLTVLQITQQGRVCLPRKVRLDSRVVRAMAESGTAGSKVEEKLGIRIERNPSESRIKEVGLRSWSKWGCPPSKFPWTYDAKETCYLLQGKVKVYPEGSTDFVEFGAGDLVVFPKGMSCTWDVSEAVDKHYQFDY